MIKKINQAPLQYQKGWTEFFKLKFFLTTDVLIPRPETELMVEEALNFFKRSNIQGSELKILDIGTGSGCIAISLAKNLPSAKVFAVDKSKKALEVAKKNARYHRVENKVLFLESNLLSIFLPQKNEHSFASNKVDVIIANLPYIPTFKLMYLDPLVRDFEPKIALDGGSDGLELYRALFTQIEQNNFYPKLLICEIDEDQGDLAKQEAKKYFSSANIEIKKDLAKKDRFLLINFSSI